jgi:phage terminase large subunit-like protein
VPIDFASIGADGVTLQLRAGGDCGNHQKVSADEDATTVKVSVVAVPPPAGAVEDAMCRVLTVTLRQVLGSRHVVDATTGALVPVTKTP